MVRSSSPMRIVQSGRVPAWGFTSVRVCALHRLQADIALNKLMFRMEKGEGSREVVALDAGQIASTYFRIPGDASYENVFAPTEVRRRGHPSLG